MPTGAGTYAYYIKCYSASLYTSSNLEADNTDPDHIGWKGYTVFLQFSIGKFVFRCIRLFYASCKYSFSIFTLKFMSAFKALKTFNIVSIVALFVLLSNLDIWDF